RENWGAKIALLHNPDFLNQHTDSLSVGLVEVTSPQNDPVIRDLRDWDNPRPAFLKDVLNGELHFYFSESHETTSRFQRGLNPPIFAAVRYLIKASQFEPKLEDRDLEKIKAIIAMTDSALFSAGHDLNN